MGMKIGFFDSGMGGLTVLKRALEQFPQEDYVYYADSKHAPYGLKTREEVLFYCHQAVRFLLNQGVELIVVACNTATSIAIKELRASYEVPIIGIEPAVKPAIERAQRIGGRVLVTATPLTIKEPKLKTLVEQCGGEACCDLLSLPRLVEWAEEGEFSPEVIVPYLKKELQSFPMSEYRQIVLGCTHFPLFKASFAALMGEEVQLIDGAEGVVKRMATYFPKQDGATSKKGNYSFYRDELPLKLSEVSVYLNQLN